MKKRIICVGNRYVPGDDTGPRVYDYLIRQPLPAGVKVIDGGISGLNLLSHIDGAERVVFVDAIKGYGSRGMIFVLDGKSIEKNASAHYGHSNGLAYLIKMLHAVCDGKAPEIILVGVEGIVEEYTIKAMADTSLKMADAGL